MNQTIKITVDGKGEVTVQTKGFTGQACRAASSFLEKALGTATGERLTAEFYQAQAEPQAMKQGQSFS